MALQNISEQFLEFLEEQEINVPEDFIQIFYSSISLDQWISSELAQKYLEYFRKNNFNPALSKFTIDQDYKEITKEEFEQIEVESDKTYCLSKSGKIQNQNNLKQHGGHLKKYYLLSIDFFKSMLLMRDSEKGRKYRNQMITLEKVFKEFMIYLQNKKDDQFINQNQIIEKKNKQLEKKTLQSERRLKKLILSLEQNQQLEQYYLEELQERDQQQLQLEAEIDELNDKVKQKYYRFGVYKIFRENPLKSQSICFSSNIEEVINRQTKLLNNFYGEQFEYNYEIIDEDLSRQKAIQLKQGTILKLTGQQKIQHIQKIKPLFE